MQVTQSSVEVVSTDPEIVARVAAVDVGKDAGVVCVRTPDESRPGQRATRVWTVPSRTTAMTALADQLIELGIDRIVLEATSDYWRPFFYLLEARGLTVWLVNAREVKNVPGRPKTDKLDAVWLAKLSERGMLHASFVPPVQIRQLRDYTRLRSDLIADRTRQAQRVEKLLEDALIKLSSVATNIMGVSSRAMLAALIDGERDPRVLAEMAKGRLRTKRAALIDALTGRFDEHHAELIDLLLSQIDSLNAQIEPLDTRIEQLLADMPAAQPLPATPSEDGATPRELLSAVDRIDEITGVGRHAAQVITAEVGLSMAVCFPPAGIWCPGPNWRHAPCNRARPLARAEPAKATTT
jgi:transposase